MTEREKQYKDYLEQKNKFDTFLSSEQRDAIRWADEHTSIETIIAVLDAESSLYKFFRSLEQRGFNLSKEEYSQYILEEMEKGEGK